MTELELFEAALDRSLADRAAFLDNACAGNQPLRQRLEALLARHNAAASFLEVPAAEIHPSPLGRGAGGEGAIDTIERPSTERIGQRIGRYRLLEQIGEGGMGAVWVAEQTEPVKRRVALKLIKPGMDSRQVLSRFEAERQALALMDHPNIAKVFDGGMTDEGRPYFVMEYVKGMPFTEYCDNARLSIQERLKLFVPVCQAVQHAHQKGVIHRDLKPNNILVCLYDGNPVPKVIDFGLAKAISQPLTENTLYTAHGLMVGTPLYMSPEQAEFNNLDIDTRADIYSLGVLLYELLAGAPPFSSQQLRAAGLNEMLRIIKEVEPHKPSTKLSSSAELPSIAANRKLEPRRLTNLLRGDLDWIVMKCLEKERGRRYETANGFALDIQRYLADEPVLAGPPSAAYRLRKFVRRNKGPVLAAAAILLLLVSGVVGTTAGLVRATRAEAIARESEAEARRQRDQARLAAAEEKKAKDAETAQRNNAESVANVLESVFKEIDPREAADDLEGQLRERLGEVEANLDKEFAGEPLVRARLRHTLAVTRYGLGDVDKTVELAEKAVAERGSLLGRDHPDTLSSISVLAGAYQSNSKHEMALALSEEVLAKRKAVLGPDHPDTLDSMDNLAEMYSVVGEHQKSLQLLEAVLPKKQEKFGPEHRQTLHCLHNLAWAYRANGQREKGLKLLEETFQRLKATVGPGDFYRLVGGYSLADMYARDGAFDKALPLYQQTVDDAKNSLGPMHPYTQTTMDRQAIGYVLAGKPDLAIPLYEETLARRQARLGENHIGTLRSMNRLAIAYRNDRKFDQALAMYQDAIGRARHTVGLNDSNTQTFIGNLIGLYNTVRKYHEAELLIREMLGVMKQTPGVDSPVYADQLVTLGANLLMQQKATDAEPVLREGLAILERSRPDAWTTYFTKSILGDALLRQQRYSDAEPLLLAGYQGLKDREASIPQQVRNTRLNGALEQLVQLYSDWGKQDEADKWRSKQQPRQHQ